MDYTIFKEALFTEAAACGFSDWEIYYTDGSSFSVKIFGGEIAEYKNTDHIGLSFRGTYKNGMGYAYTEKLDKSIIPKLIKNAAENASVIEEKEIEVLYRHRPDRPEDAAYPEIKSYNPTLEKTSVKEKIDLALAMERCAYNRDPRVKSVDYCQLGTSKYTVKIANSYGLDLSTCANFAYGYVMARVEDKVTKTAHEIWHGNDFSKFSYEEVAKKAVDRALSYLGAKSLESAEYPVIFDNRTACELMGAFSPVFFAENAQKGFSLLKGREGELIASAKVTLRDDPEGPDLSGGQNGGHNEDHNYETFANTPFDSEGVATRPKAVIEKGQLKTLLYNTKSAAKEGVSSTGNGFKSSFQSSVTTACTNFYIMPSGISPEELRKDIKKGVLITEVAGLHSGLNTISGDFSISASGFLVEGGQIARPVEQITVAGNFYKMLKNIRQVGSDLRFEIPDSSGTFGMPSILVDGLSVSGAYALT